MLDVESKVIERSSAELRMTLPREMAEKTPSRKLASLGRVVYENFERFGKPSKSSRNWRASARRSGTVSCAPLDHHPDDHVRAGGCLDRSRRLRGSHELGSLPPPALVSGVSVTLKSCGNTALL